jgi:hypothetical protein
MAAARGHDLDQSKSVQLFFEHAMPFDLAARCVELIAELRGPEAERAAGVLGSLVRQ